MFISTTLNRPGLMGCYKMWKQLYLISFDLSSSIVTTDSSVFYPFECYLELVEEYSEGKIYKCEPEPRNGTVNIVYTLFTGQGKHSLQLHRVCFDERACSCKCLL